MSDVFVSYARSNEVQAEHAEKALRESGYAVWRDAELPAHRAYAEVIEERLKSADAVLVLWSAEAAKSQWVRAEADAAREMGTLVQASVDGTIPPIPFNQIQCADVTDWIGDSDHSGWRKVLGSLSALAGAPAEVAETRPARKRKSSVCVLPFVNMSGDAEQEYFSDGISEDITTDLSQVSALAVTARNTAFTFKGTAVDIPTIARKLGVTHVLEGSVRRAANRVRITAQLIDGETGDHIWAERFDRDLDDIFAIQDEISKAIVDALKVKLLPEEKQAIGDRCTCNADAYNLYLMARDSLARGNHGDPKREERVIRLCKRAVEIDPDYAQAWALMATAQSTLRYGFGLGEEDGVAAAKKALAIDPGLVEAHCPLARGLIERRRFAEAEKVIARALEIDPNSWEAHYEGSRLHIRKRNLEGAVRHLERCVSIVDSDFYSAGMLLSFYRALGDSTSERRAAERALALAESALSHDPNNGAALSVGARALASLGEAARAREWIERGLLLDPENLNMRYNFASVQAAFLNDKEAALALLEPTMAKATGNLIRWAEAIDPDVEAIRDDSRFKQMIAKAKERVARTAGTVEAPQSGAVNTTAAS